MYSQYATWVQASVSGKHESQQWAHYLEDFLTPHCERLDAYLDRRLVGNVTALIATMVQTRVPLTLTELGAGLCGPDHTDAGTQRIERLLQHPGWSAQVLEEIIWQQADQHLHQLLAHGETPLCIWDSSVLEKPESEQLEGLGTVRSSRARRLGRNRKGVFNRSGGKPVSVRGFEWESLLLVGPDGVPHVAAMKWWGREKGVSGQQRQQQHALLRQVSACWGRWVRQIFDRGYSTARWLWDLDHAGARFVMRWKKGNQLIDKQGQERKAWEIARGKRSWKETKLLWDTHSRVHRSTRVVAMPVRHPQYRGQLWLVVVRQGREPWYLLTNEPVETEAQAWEIAFSYARRWKIEESFRFQKTELNIESLRVRDWEPRRKLLVLLTLAYSFLLWARSPQLAPACIGLQRRWQHRADWRQWKVKLPLYRLRWALSRLWGRYPPSFATFQPYRPHTHITWRPVSTRWWMTIWHWFGYPF